MEATQERHASTAAAIHAQLSKAQQQVGSCSIALILHVQDQTEALAWQFCGGITGTKWLQWSP